MQIFTAKKFTKIYKDLQMSAKSSNFAGDIVQKRTNVKPLNTPNSMRRIEFIAPVEAMRGNISGSQKLLYAKNNNPAFYAPSGRNAARNYTPRYIGAKRFNGVKSFRVKTDHIINLTSKSIMAMALLGGSASCYNQAIRSLMILSNLQRAFLNALALDPTLTMRKWLQPMLYAMLENKRPSLSINDGTTTVVINNPWVQGGTGTDLPIPQKDLVKFWPQLAKNGTMFHITLPDGRVKDGICYIGQTFQQLIAIPRLNVLDLIGEQAASGTVVMFNPTGPYLQKNDAYVLETETITSQYTATEDAPE